LVFASSLVFSMTSLISPIESALRIRTGEKDDAAI
jgi:nitrogen regulatory protein PII